MVKVHGRELYKLVTTVIKNYEVNRNLKELTLLKSTKKLAQLDAKPLDKNQSVLE